MSKRSKNPKICSSAQVKPQTFTNSKFPTTANCLMKTSPAHIKKPAMNDNEPLNHINTEAQAIARGLKLDDRIESFAKREAFVTVKEHKDNFVSYPKCRLINPAKSEIGKISKHHLDTINTTIHKKIKLNQWHSTSSVIAWFSNIPKKNECKFLKFDIVNFYASITQELLTASIGFAREHMEIRCTHENHSYSTHKEKPGPKSPAAV